MATPEPSSSAAANSLVLGSLLYLLFRRSPIPEAVAIGTKNDKLSSKGHSFYDIGFLFDMSSEAATSIFADGLEWPERDTASELGDTVHSVRLRAPAYINYMKVRNFQPKMFGLANSDGHVNFSEFPHN